MADNYIQAKMCVLGDRGTGKSKLISTLVQVNAEASDGSSTEAPGARNTIDDDIFTSIVIPASDLQSTKSNINVKVWEYTSHLSKEETELVLRGALFCIITFDLRNPESANSAFNNWLLLKETFMNESFLFVVGTHVDFTTSRRVEVADLAKACAQKDAIYLEVSSEDGTNMALLRRLLIQRINFMLGIREEITQQASQKIGAGGDSDDESDYAAKQANETKRRYARLFSENNSDLLDTKFLEQEIISESVGSILSSALGIEFWPGFQAEEENLKRIGTNICDHVRELALDPSSAPATPLEYVLQSVPPLSAAQAEGKMLPMPDAEELRQVFEIMGFQLPPTLLSGSAAHAATSRDNDGDGDGHSASSISTPSLAGTALGKSGVAGGKSKTAAAATPSTIRLKVALPDGKSADIQIYPGFHVGRQVDAFLIQHGLDDDDDARRKLTSAAEQLAAKHFK